LRVHSSGTGLSVQRHTQIVRDIDTHQVPSAHAGPRCVCSMIATACTAKQGECQRRFAYTISRWWMWDKSFWTSRYIATVW